MDAIALMIWFAILLYSNGVNVEIIHSKNGSNFTKPTLRKTIKRTTVHA
jgi:hypothetical protein